MAYVYTHTRTDNSEIFYIGIGKYEFQKGIKYKRAYITKGRSGAWYRVTKQTRYTINIVQDSLTWEEACLVEKELITKYGRVCENTGPLVNITAGGDGFVALHNNSTKEKIRAHYKGKTYDELYGDRAEEERNKRKKVTRSVEQYSETNKRSGLAKRGVPHTKEHIEKAALALTKYRDISCYNKDGELVHQYLTLKELKRDGFCRAKVSQVLRGLRADYKGLLWKCKID